MIIFGCCVPTARVRYDQVAGPAIDKIAVPDDLILVEDGSEGIAIAYNRIIDRARLEPECQALVLLHDDLEIVDSNFRAKLLGSLRETDVGLVGVIGGARLSSLAWWEARDRFGAAFESRGLIEFGRGYHDVDAVDGMMLAIAPVAFTNFVFDSARFPAFHGYDIDYCFQVRSAGLRVRVVPLSLVHRTKTGLGDRKAFLDANQLLTEKWGGNYIQSLKLPERLRRRFQKKLSTGVRRARRGRELVRKATAYRSSAMNSGIATPVDRTTRQPDGAPRVCVACGSPFQSTPPPSNSGRILTCLTCGTGHTWPLPTRQVEGDGLWMESYGNSRLRMRDQWYREARQRLEWVQLYQPEGDLLELGCGTGEFLDVAQQNGFDSYGIEPSHWAAQEAQKLHPNVLQGSLEDWLEQFKGLRPDVIALWHVLEHVPDPLTLLQQLRIIIAPTGVLAIEVPNYASSEARRLGEQWGSAQLADHVHHYTPKGLGSILLSAGFVVDALIPFSGRVYGSTGSWRRQRNTALLQGWQWPSLDLLRVVARVADDPGNGGAGLPQ